MCLRARQGRGLGRVSSLLMRYRHKSEKHTKVCCDVVWCRLMCPRIGCPSPGLYPGDDLQGPRLVRKRLLDGRSSGVVG